MQAADVRQRLNVVPITSPDGVMHLVDEAVFATSPDGVYRSRCGSLVVSAALEEEPGRSCPLCGPELVARLS